MERENFTEWRLLATIRNESKIYSATGDGKMPFISATDFAHVAFRALVDTNPHNTDYQVLGPELLTYDDAYPLSGSDSQENKY